MDVAIATLTGTVDLACGYAFSSKVYARVERKFIEAESPLWVTYRLRRTSALLRLLEVKRKESQKADADRVDREVRTSGEN